jgi:putative hydrolase
VNYEDAAAALSEIGYYLRHQQDVHRARAFHRVAATLLRERPDLEELRRSGRLESLPGVGAGIARVLTELIDGGGSAYLDRLREESGEPVAEVVSVSPLAAQGYRGDLHCHTDWSDGGATVMEMAQGARGRGYEYVCITDHSPRITVVNGLGPERLAAQRRLIDEANAKLEGITVLQGIEVDILEDGSLDLPDETLAGLDLVVASPHLKLRQEKAAMTERMLRAVTHPHVDIVGHPTGRRPGSRAGAEYDFEAVFTAAAGNGVAMEIDCDPARMDLSPELARLAADCGCRLALDSDAHAPDQFVYVDLGLWMARKAGLDPSALVNWLPLDELRRTFQR